MWSLSAGRRDAVRVDAAPAEEALAPRAFLMTAIARLACCDLFIHGTGGERYERVTEAWVARWLGLPLARQLIEAHGGKLALISEPGEGTVFTIELPRGDLPRIAKPG